MILDETSFKRLEKHIQNNDVCFISGSRHENEPKENLELTKELANDLRHLGYGFTKIKGGYIEDKGLPTEKVVEEISFAVFNNNDKWEYHIDFKKDMLGLCRKYKQNAILLKMKNEKAGYYKGNGELDGDEFTTITKDNVGEYYSKLNKTKFSFVETDNEFENYSKFEHTFSSKVLGNILRKKLDALE